MTLPFSTAWPDRMGDLAGQPNYFVHRILLGLSRNSNDYTVYHRHMYHYLERGGEGVSLIETQIAPKLHTIRKDPHNRWRPGMKIHPVVNNRTKNRFQFIHDLVCTAVQEIELKYYKSGIDLLIDGKVFYSPFTDKGMQRLALNDGFPSVEAFFAWFNEDFQGKIIHWTDLRY